MGGPYLRQWWKMDYDVPKGEIRYQLVVYGIVFILTPVCDTKMLIFCVEFNL